MKLSKGQGKAQTKKMIRSATDPTPETLALLKVLALTNKEIEEGKTRPATQAFKRIRDRVTG